MSLTLLAVNDVGKKFCRSLKLSLWYGLNDIRRDLFGIQRNSEKLRKNEFWAVDHLNFKLNVGETLGLIGPNGAGKTTALRMLNGLIKPDYGSISVKGRMQALIALGAGFNPVLTGRENVYVNGSVLGLRNSEINKKFDSIVEFSEIEEFIDSPVQSYSSGMIVRLGFAVAAHLDPNILLVDEVLAVGDEGFQHKCLNKIGELKRNGTAIILVSHNMHTISTFSDRVIVLNRGVCEEYSNVSEGIKFYRQFFENNQPEDIQKVSSGNDQIEFFDVKIDNQDLAPGDSFRISMKCVSKIDFKNVEIDMGIYSSREPFFHFQATNKAYNRLVDLNQGQNSLEIVISDIRINGANGKIVISIWENQRKSKLFWWRIPVVFKQMNHSTGNSFLATEFNIK